MVLDDVIEDFHTRDLLEICQGTEYKINLLGNDYCRIALDHKRNIECEYLDNYLDQNNMRQCLYEKIKK